MPDPHVEALYYRFKSLREHDSFDGAAKLETSLGDFDVVLADGELTARPRVHFADRETARDAFEPLLRSWEEAAFLSGSAHRIKFAYERTEIIDRRADPRSVFAFAEVALGGAVAFDATIARRNSAYPPPDPAYVATPDTEWMTEKLRRVRDGEAELVATAYNMLTRVESFGSGGGSQRRETAADSLNIERDILNQLGRLTDMRDPEHGRKSGASEERLAMEELEWIRAAIVLLTRRTGEKASGASLTRITMSDLPPRGT